MSKLTLTVTIHHEGQPPASFTAVGRVAWALLHLLNAGPKGITVIERPAPRWSQYIMLLRRSGVAIETRDEPHEGDFAGHHGRYILHSRVTVAGGNLTEWLQSPTGRRDFPDGLRPSRLEAA
ncbi:winged helix domain-containing protein [Pelagibacterium luteolum]|uniref:Winged helix domain-containing protein n=1 Tax=Pelagibacterium luteolum TaxID=440168 RepID=A0A1G7S6Y8_9HYPH|nr:hypothetical protein [Pelagibacterium luteolum]SDG18787.1 hypothetical protein SAMN04487974_101341 [Pelagibacterium luteolum]